MMMPSTVGVPAVVLSMTTFKRSPAAPIHEMAGVLSSDGVVPATPPPCTGIVLGSFLILSTRHTFIVVRGPDQHYDLRGPGQEFVLPPAKRIET